MLFSAFSYLSLLLNIPRVQECKGARISRISIGVQLRSLTGAFKSCSSLKEVFLPAGIKSIGSNAFSDCVSLKTIALPEGIELIGSNVFDGCSSLEEIVLPASVKTLERQPLSNCDKLKRIFYEGTEAEWSALTPQENYAYVDYDGSIVLVESPFSNAQVYFYSETKPDEAGNYWHYVDNTPTIW